MKRICFVGNSHVASVKQALDTLTDRRVMEHVEVSIFGSPASSLQTARVDGGILSSTDPDVRENFSWTSGGSSEVRISDFDHVLFLLGASFFNWFALFRAASDIPVISRGLFEEIVSHSLNGWPMKLARDAAKADENVLVSHVGAPFTSVENPNVRSFVNYLQNEQNGFSERVEKIRTLLDEKAAKLSVGNFQFMKPPTAALDPSGLFTQHSFCQGSVRLTSEMNVTHPTDDYEHMNAAFGRLLIEQALGISL